MYLNDLQTPYVSYTYVEETGGGKSVTATLCNDQTLFTETDTKGRLIRSKVGNLQTTFAYDSRGRQTKCTDGISGDTTYAYDSLDRVTQITAPAVTETFTYANGALATKSVTVGGVNTVTSYAYKNNAAKDLQSVTIGSTIVKPQTDCLGRNIGKEIYAAGKKVASESISYRKAGDHATNMPSSMRFGHRTPADQNVIASEAKQSATDKFVILESLQYKYDTCGNIAEIRENGALYAKYTYDALNRLIREDNKKLNKTVLFTYDNNGNILNKRVLAFTSKTGLELDEMTSADTLYAYDGDRLLSFGDETCTYDVLGNPTTYRGKTCAWENGRRLTAYDNATFAYDARGRRTSKTYNGKTTSFTYDNAGNLLKQSNGLSFIYDHSGIIGVKNAQTTYFYRKNVQGDVIAILDNDGKVVVKYNYDAWGNHEVRDVDGNALTDSTHIGNLNPFRYRGYYYDTETGLYFLKTRYYDPDISRFITIDDLDYLDPETINGLNLYAYCGDNPVVHVDPFGKSWQAVVAFLVFSTFMGAMGGLAGAAINERDLAIGAAIGAIGGLLNGGAALGLSAIGAPYLFPIVATVTGGVSELLNQVFNHEEINWWAIATASFNGVITGGISYFVGKGVEPLIEMSLSYIMTTVFLGFQAIFDFLGSKFGNWLENGWNQFKKFFGIGKKPSRANTGVGGGFGGGGGRSW